MTNKNSDILRCQIKVQFDGVCEPINPKGNAAYGLLIRQKRCILLLEEGVFVGKGEGMSNNYAEYSGFLRALEFLKDRNLNRERILVEGDSKLVIEQMSGNWKIKHGFYKTIALKAQKLLKDFPNIIFQWIPRDKNEQCDKLAKDVLHKMNVKFRIQPD